MKHYSINDLKKWKSLYHYVAQIDSNLWSLYDYIHVVNPNYQILNDTAIGHAPLASAPGWLEHKYLKQPYYDNDELQLLELCHTFQIQVQGSTTLRDAVVFFPNRLNYHQGLLNQYPNIDTNSRFLFFGSWKDFKKNILAMSETDTVLKPLPEEKIIDLYQSYSNFLPFKTAFLIISQARTSAEVNNPDNEYRKDIHNYLYCRLSALAPYYILYNHIQTTNASGDSQVAWVWKYDEAAEEKYGSDYLFSIGSNQTRFLYQELKDNNIIPHYSGQDWYEAAGQHRALTIKSFNWVDDHIDTNQIQLISLLGSPWTYNLLIDHYFFHEKVDIADKNTIHLEDIFAEDSNNIGYTTFDGKTVPTYTINMGKTIVTKPDLVKFFLW